MTTTPALISIDGGKSELRVLVAKGGGREYAVGPGMAYLPDEDGVGRILDNVRTAAATITMPTEVAGVIAGLTGLPGDPALRRVLADGLTTMFNAPSLVVDDVLLAHAGAIDGPGTVLCLGTGTNVLAIAQSGEHARLDGWGPLLGDRGSGYAIGLAGLRAATASLDDVGPDTVLAESLTDGIGGTELADLQRFYRDPNVVARVAAFARHVVEAASYDPVAQAICDDAADDLATAAQAATEKLADPERRVSYSGRLITADGYLRAKLRAELLARRMALTDPIDSPLEGGLILLKGGMPYRTRLTQMWQETNDLGTGGLE